MTDAHSRYPGTRPFSDSPDDVMRFFGREAEADELYLRVLSVPLLVQFGKSGLGKTSLLQAGLFPRLRQKPFLPVMIRLNDEDESLTAAVARAIRESCKSEGIEATQRNTDGLWELLSTTTIWRDDLLLTPVLVFDQFEEVFTLRNAAFRAEIATELGALASGIPPARVQGGRRPAVKVVISLREDYLGALEEFSAAIPGLFQERLRLGPLTEEAARDAIIGPAQLIAPDAPPPFEIEPAALDQMIAELKGKSGEIEAFQLQLLARHAETIAARKGAGARLTPDDFRGTHDFESVLKNFYRDTLQRITPRSQRTRAQRLVEEGLLGPTGNRLPLEERQILSEHGVTLPTLQTLESSRLVRRERRLESEFYEVSHDRLADSIFRGRTFKVSRKTRRMMWAAAAGVLFLLVIVAGLIVAHRRVSGERDVAERWVGLLLGEEFFGELRDSGRSTVSKRLQDQIVTGSKAGLGTPMTRGLALRNDGDLQRLDGTLTDALKSFDAALQQLESAPRDVSSMREIARTHDRIGEALVQQGEFTKALQHCDRAVAAWRSVVEQKSALVNDDCVALTESLTATAALNGRMGRREAALRLSDDAVDIAFGAMFDTPDRCGRRPGTVEPDPDVRAMGILARIALVHHDLRGDASAVEGAAALAGHARELSPPSVKATALAMEAMKRRGSMRLSKGLDAVLQDYMEVLNHLRGMQLWDIDNRAWQHDRAVVRSQVARMLSACIFTETGCAPGMVDEAEVTAADAEATLQKLSEADPTSLSLHQDLIAALRAHATVLTARGPEFQAQSMARYDEAERLLTSRRRDPSDPRAADELATLLVDKAASLGNLGDLQQAAATLQRAENVLERAVSAHPDRLLFVSTLHQVRGFMSQLHTASGNTAAAAEATAEAEALQPRFAPHHADIKNVDALQQRGVEERLRADALLRSDPAAALRELNASEATFRAVIRRRPSYGEGYVQLVQTYIGMNAAFGSMGRPEEQLYALAAATTAAQLARWLAPTGREHEANEWLLTTRYLLGHALSRQNRRAEAVDALESVVSLWPEFRDEPTPDGGSLGLIGDAKCRIADMQRELKQAGWWDTLAAGIIYLRQASALDPRQEEKLRYWTNYLAAASEGAPAAQRP